MIVIRYEDKPLYPEWSKHVKEPRADEPAECTVEEVTLGENTIHFVDACVVPEIQSLTEQGITTVCSCCGHGSDGDAYIRVTADSIEKMEALGYEPYEMHDCMIFPDDSKAFRAKTVKCKLQKEGDT